MLRPPFIVITIFDVDNKLHDIQYNIAEQLGLNYDEEVCGYRFNIYLYLYIPI